MVNTLKTSNRQMKIALKIKTLCCNSININSIDIINESHLHNTPLNSETHFKLIIVTDDFVGLKLIERHKKVHKVLAGLLDNIHALSMHLFTSEEFKDNKSDLESPQCVNKK